MYEHYYGFSEKPFSLTPDPKYLYRSQPHGDAFDLLQYAIRRREGFVVVTGDIGTGKTTLCRALLEQIDRTTFTALVLNPFLTEEDLLKRILQDFGVISRDDVKSGRMANVTKQELIETLYDFLLSLVPIKAGAVLIIDEAQNLPLPVLEQIRILSNLETDKDKLLQIILVGQLNLQTVLRSPDMRQLDQRVSIRYQLEPLDADTVAAYVAHRLTIAGGGAAVAFTAKAAAAGSPVVGRHPAADQPDLRPRAARGVLGSRPSRHDGDGHACGREPRHADAADQPSRLVQAQGIARRGVGRRAAVVVARGRRVRVRLPAFRHGRADRRASPRAARPVGLARRSRGGDRRLAGHDLCERS